MFACGFCSSSFSTKRQLHEHNYDKHAQLLTLSVNNSEPIVYKREEEGVFVCSCNAYTSDSLKAFGQHLLKFCSHYKMSVKGPVTEREAEDLEGSTLLRSYGLVMNSTYGCLICFHCKKMLPLSDLAHGTTHSVNLTASDLAALKEEVRPLQHESMNYFYLIN